MDALVYTGVKSLTFQSWDDPQAGADDNLIEISSVGICGSDMHAYLGHDARRPAPLILGHEGAGTVLSGPMAGKRVTINPLVSCTTCRHCLEGRSNLCETRQIISMPPRQGAFAQKVAMPTSNLVEVPDNVSFDHAALAEPLAVCWHAVRLSRDLLVKPMEEARALVIGGGAIGLGSALCLDVFGVRDVTLVETNPARLSYLSEHTKAHVTTPDALKPSDFDLVIDAVGFGPTRATASEVVRPGGAICHIGLGDSKEGFDVRRATLQEITFFGTYTYTPDEFRDTAQAIFDGRLGPLDWIETRPLSQGASAFSEILDGKIAAPKIVLNPQE